jgi:hypothetical protein
MKNGGKMLLRTGPSSFTSYDEPRRESALLQILPLESIKANGAGLIIEQ